MSRPDMVPPDPIQAALSGAEEASQEPWPEPDLSVVEEVCEPAPALPLDCFGDLAATIEAEARLACAPPDFVAAGLLAVVASRLAGTREVKIWRSWHEPAVLNCVAVAPPSAGKSPGLDVTLKPLARVERKLVVEHEKKLADWEQKLVVAQAAEKAWKAEVAAAAKAGDPPPEKPKEAELPPPPPYPALRLNDTTPEALHRVLLQNPRGVLVARDELSGWFGSMGRYHGKGDGSGDRAMWIEAYGARPWRIDRAGEKDPRTGQAKPLYVPRLAVPVLGGIQPDKLREAFGRIDDGLPSRCLFFWPDKYPELEEPDDDAADGREQITLLIERMVSLHVEIEDGASKPLALPFTRGGRRALLAFGRRVRERLAAASGFYLSWLGKARGTAARLALVLSHVDWAATPGRREPHCIEAKYVERAIALLESYFEPMAIRAFGEAALPEAERDAAALARWLLRQQPVPETVNARELRRSRTIPTKEARGYDAALAELVGAGWLRPKSRTRQFGRCAKTFEVSPKLREKNVVPKYPLVPKMPNGAKRCQKGVSAPNGTNGTKESFGTNDAANSVEPETAIVSQTGRSRAEAGPLDEIALAPWGAALDPALAGDPAEVTLRGEVEG